MLIKALYIQTDSCLTSRQTYAIGKSGAGLGLGTEVFQFWTCYLDLKVGSGGMSVVLALTIYSGALQENSELTSVNQHIGVFL